MKLYFIGGKAGSGKDTFGLYLKEMLEDEGKKVCLLKITDPLNALLKSYFNWDGKRETKPRALMQKIGYDVISEKLGKKTFLVDILKTKIDVLNDYYDVGIITDGRLTSEMQALQEEYQNFVSIHLIRNSENDLSEAEQKHITEIDFDNKVAFDYNVENTTLTALKIAAYKIVKEGK